MSRIRSKRSKFVLLLEYAVYRCFEWSFQLIPPRMVDRLGQHLGAIAYHLFPARRRIVRRNCRIACQDPGNPQELERLTQATFRRNGANLLGGMRCMIMDDDAIRKHVSLEGEDLVRDVLMNQQKGMIFALCHMGNWEILARIAHLIAPGVPAGAFYRPLNNPWMNRMTKRRRQRSGTKLFSNKEGFNQSVPLLRSGGMLGILADQHAGRSGCLSTFFGRPTACSPLVELLHRRTAARVFYISITRDAPAHWHIAIMPHDADTAVNTRSVMSGIEEALSRSLCDGFWLHNRWKQPSRTPLHHPHARECLDPTKITKPWRWIFITSARPAIAEAATPAMKSAIRQAARTEVVILHSLPVRMDETFVECRERECDLAQQLARLDTEKNYPVDLIVFFCDLEEIDAPSLRSIAPMVIGIGHQKHKALVRTIRPTAALDEEKTWWDFIKALGVSEPPSMEPPSS